MLQKTMEHEYKGERRVSSVLQGNAIMLPKVSCPPKSITYEGMCYSLTQTVGRHFNITNVNKFPEELQLVLYKHAVCLDNYSMNNKFIRSNKEPCDILIRLVGSTPKAVVQTSYKGQFLCLDKHYISDTLLRNGESNCPDGSDETYNPDACWDSNRIRSLVNCSRCQLPSCKCLTNYYQCRSGGCISWNKVCNKINDCPHGSDEEKM